MTEIKSTFERNFIIKIFLILCFVLFLNKFIFVNGYENITIQETKENIDSNPLIFILDVSSSKEYYEGHIKGAVNINIYFLMEKLDLLPQNKSSEIIIYCDDGFRSKVAAEKLDELEYLNVFNMAQGFSQWIRAGYPYIIGSETSPTSEMKLNGVFYLELIITFSIAYFFVGKLRKKINILQ